MERAAIALIGGRASRAPARNSPAAEVEGRGWTRFPPLPLRSALASLRHRSVQGAMQANGTATSALSGGRASTTPARNLPAAAVEGRGWPRFHPLQLPSALASLRHRSVQGARVTVGTAGRR